MSKHRNATRLILSLTAMVAVTACSGGTLNPSHYGKYEFEGTVKTTDGKPVSGAWVKVREWQTVTDENGRWKQEHLVHCGAMKDEVSGFEEQDAILVTKEGFASTEERFVVKHPAWFNSCKPDQKLLFETVLAPVGAPKPIDKKQDQPQLPTGGGTYL